MLRFLIDPKNTWIGEKLHGRGRVHCYNKSARENSKWSAGRGLKGGGHPSWFDSRRSSGIITQPRLAELGAE